MQPAVLIRLRPRGPWRYGPGDGGRDRLDTLYRSDRLYSAITIAMKQLGFLAEWLDATAGRPIPAVTFTSLFPFQGEMLFVTPPITLWPPAPALITAPSATFLAKIRWGAAHFVPSNLVESLLLGHKILADQWTPDPQSGCLLRRDRPNTAPFYSVVRRGAAVDRVNQSAVEVHSFACVEFQPGSGLWTAARFHDDQAKNVWSSRVKAALRLLVDTGFGGRRTSGWGVAEAPDFQDGAWPGLLFPKLARLQAREADAATEGPNGSLYWLLSLYSPAPADTVDWSNGNYQTTIRGGHVDGAAGGGRKKRSRVVAEGSVLTARSEPVGTTVDVSPDGFAHPIYRSGFAVALKLPTIDIAAELAPVEAPADPDAIEATPCDIDQQPPAEGTAEPQKLEEQISDEDDAVSLADVQPETPLPVDSPVEDFPEPTDETARTPEVEPHLSESGASVEEDSHSSPMEPSTEIEPQSGGSGEGSVEDAGGSEETEREL